MTRNLGRGSRFDFGGASYAQSEDYFLLRTPAFDAAPTAHSDLELMAVLGMRWWTVDEVEAASRIVFPFGLGPLARDLLAGRLPGRPVRLPWHH